MSTIEERRAYSRGYSRAASGRWPNVDRIPDEEYRELAAAAMELAGEVDALLAQYGDRDEDPIQIRIDAARDRVVRAIDAARDHALKSAEGSA